MCNLPIGGATKSACPVESVDEKVRCDRAFIEFL